MLNAPRVRQLKILNGFLHRKLSFPPTTTTTTTTSYIAMSQLGLTIYHRIADRFLTAFNMLRPSHSDNAPAVHFTLPPSHFFQFPPNHEPSSLRPPIADRTFARPFTIDPEIYNNALHVAVPISVALVYAALVTVFNRVNKQREHKPWAWSKSVPFYAFVLTHNIFLALYSAWTCLGMLNAFTQSWPGLRSRYGVVGAVDSLCKIHGPRGLGSAATYDSNSSSWGVTDRLVQLLNGSPDSTDVGRIWNEGLAFYGWLFYISKLYEITDTFIVLAKGKKSSVLQTYHHAGAMMCMWAGIRYMSPPIWMFVFINSGLHAAMVFAHSSISCGPRKANPADCKCSILITLSGPWVCLSLGS